MPELSDDYRMFFEELSTDESLRERLYQEDALETDDEENIGLSQDSVHKLTEDIMNPLPPSE